MSPRRKACISIFIVAWTLVFHYESIRHQWLNPLFRTELPKVKLLFPPAGWIMFFRVDESSGGAEVYGIKGQSTTLIDPHRIFATRWVGYDNIHRNVLITVLHPGYSQDFCGYLRRKFPEYDGFAVVEVWIRSVIEGPDKKLYHMTYRC